MQTKPLVYTSCNRWAFLKVKSTANSNMVQQQQQQQKKWEIQTCNL